MELHSPLRLLSVLVVVVGCSTASGHRPTDLKQLTLDAYIGATSASQTRELFREQGLIMENATAACMRRHGFPYVPNAESYVPPEATKTPIADLTSRNYAQEHGFGLVEPFTNPPPSPPLDPNAALFQRLSVAEQNEYNRTLDAVDATGSNRASCRGEAEQAFVDQSGGRKFTEDLQLLMSRTEGEPVIVAALARWRACAKAVGYEFESRRAMIDSINRKIDATQAAEPHDVNQPATANAQAQLTEIRRYEIGAATATFDCSTAYDRVFRDAIRAAAGIQG